MVPLTGDHDKDNDDNDDEEEDEKEFLLDYLYLWYDSEDPDWLSC